MQEKKSNGLAIASLVLGIISIGFTLCAFPMLLTFIIWFTGPFIFIVGITTGIVGIVLGAIAKKRNPTKMAKLGLILSIIGLVLTFLEIIYSIAYIFMALGQI